MDNDTIAAVATPRGSAARGIVRLSGRGAVAAAEALLDAPVGEGTYLRLRRNLVMPATAPFPVVVYLMRAPRSYTREDVVEIHAPGSPPLLSMILATLCRAGARQAEPGEFTRRAFLNGRIDLAQAEAVMAVIHARTVEEERLAVAALGGSLSAEVRGIRAGLVGLSADIEVGLDFSEDEMVFAPPERQADEIGRAGEAIAGLLAESAAKRVFREETLAVLYGPANAGKSSVFNMLVGSHAAIVSRIAGTTRDYLEAPVAFEGVNFTLVDTAGMKPPASIIEEAAVGLSRRLAHEGGRSQVMLFTVDASLPVTPEVEALYARAKELPHVVLLNKSDLPPAPGVSAWRGGLLCEALDVSAASGRGGLEILAAMAALVRAGEVDLSTMRFVLADRQRQALGQAADLLERAREAVAGREGDEIVSLIVREAIEALGAVTGEDYVEDLLDEVFSRFCLGK